MHNFKLQPKHFALLGFVTLMLILMVVTFVGSQKSKELRSKAAYPPPPPTVPPILVVDTCTVTLSHSNITPGTAVTVTYTGKTTGATKNASIWINKQPNTVAGGDKISPLETNPQVTEMKVPPAGNWPTKDFYQYYAVGCSTANGSQCSSTLAINNIPVGSYNVFCSVATGGTTPPGCSGQPFCDYYGGPSTTCVSTGWKACGTGDHVTLTVSDTVAPSVTPSLTGVVTPTDVPPSCMYKKYGDANCDGSVDGIDYSIWLNSQCRPGSGQKCANTKADFNNDGNVDDEDYQIWFDGRNTVSQLKK